MELTITLSSLEQTKKMGIELGRIAQAGDVVCLDGDLGAGKTTLCQSIAVGLEVPDEYYITSPSFAIIHEYPGRIPLYHMDFYRLHDSGDVEELGITEYFYGNGLTVVEWADRASAILPRSSLHLFIQVTGENSRTVRCWSTEERWQARVERITARR